MEAIILAGGFGKRLQSVVRDVPKPMADIDGRPFLSYIIEYLSEHGIKKVFLSVGYMHEKIIRYFGNNYSNLDIEYVIEHKPLGTGGAITEALRHTKEENILVLNGDTFFKIDPLEMLKFHKSKKAHMTIALKPMPDASRYGTVEAENQRVVGFKEKSLARGGYINAGIYILDRKLLEILKSYGEVFSFEIDFLPKNIINLRVFAFIRDSYFIDIGVPEDYEKAKTKLRAVLKRGF